MINYHIHNWLPLNSDNYKKYQNISILSERINFLEKILVGKIYYHLQKGARLFLILTFHLHL
ncbi:MAG: CRISPR-associated endonuclease Cas6 [Bacteroides fragilis]